LLTFLFLVASSIQEKVPGAVVFRNHVPKEWAHHDMYVGLIPNEDESLHVYQQ